MFDASRARHFRGKHEGAAVPRIVEWLDPEMIAGQEQARQSAVGPRVPRVPDREGKDSPQSRDTVRTPPSISLENDLCVALGRETLPAQFQLSTQFSVVINLPIEGNPRPGSWIVHRLMSSRRQIDNGQTPVTENDSRFRPANLLQAIVIGATMSLSVRHRAQFSEPWSQQRAQWRLYPLYRT